MKGSDRQTAVVVVVVQVRVVSQVFKPEREDPPTSPERVCGDSCRDFIELCTGEHRQQGGHDDLLSRRFYNLV